jgi:hypothetical protein
LWSWSWIRFAIAISIIASSSGIGGPTKSFRSQVEIDRVFFVSVSVGFIVATPCSAAQDKYFAEGAAAEFEVSLPYLCPVGDLEKKLHEERGI